MYRAKDTFWAPDNRRIVKGDLVSEYDPVVQGREDLFEAVVIPQALTPAQAAAARQETEPDGDAGSSPSPSAPAAKKSAAKKTTAASKPAGGDAQ